MDSETTIEELKLLVAKFRDARDWKQFHNPKDLAVDISIEAGELLDHFRFKTNEEARQRVKDSKWREEIGHEMADILWGLLHLSDETGIDLSEALQSKVRISEDKYPADLVKGKSKKYSEY